MRGESRLLDPRHCGTKQKRSAHNVHSVVLSQAFLRLWPALHRLTWGKIPLEALAPRALLLTTFHTVISSARSLCMLQCTNAGMPWALKCCGMHSGFPEQVEIVFLVPDTRHLELAT